ncbi:MAG: sulfur reduction protein DsrJ [Chromatiales bacterium]|nr:sulfur reduction protein DsrJ [Chromatiales bacterium]
MRSSTGIKQLTALLLGGLLLVLSTAGLSESAVTKGSKAAEMDACVAPTDEMRRNHMDYLQHDRDLTVHKGVRNVTNSLAECVDCHAAKDENGQAIPVDAPGQFCAGCHEYVAVSLACFQCHRKTPEDKSSALESEPTGGKLGLLLDAGKQPTLTPAELDQLHARILED